MAGYFNGALFRRNLKRFWPLTVLCFITAFLVFIAPQFGRINNGYDVSNSDMFMLIAGYSASAIPVFSAFSALCVFGYLHNARAACYISSMPITRGGLFVTNFLSGLVIVLLSNLIVGILLGFTLLTSNVTFTAYLTVLGVMLAAHLLFYSMAVFCAFITGNPFMQVFLYVLLNFLYPLFYVTVAAIGEFMVYGYNGALEFWGQLSPPIAMVYNLYNLYNTTNVGGAMFTWLCYLVLAAVLTAGSFMLYRRRKIESAGEVILHKPLRYIFKYALAFLIGVYLGALMVGITGGFYNQNQSVKIIVNLTVWVSVFGALGCLFLEMLIKKRLRVWNTAWKGILCFVCGIIALALFIRLDGTGFEHRVPDAQNVAAVSVTRWNRMDSALLHDGGGERESGAYNAYRLNTSGRNWYLTRDYIDRQAAAGLPVYNDEILREIKLRLPEYYESSEGIAAAIAFHNAALAEKSELTNLRDSVTPFVITYKLKDGGEITRRYYLPYSEDYALASKELLIGLYNLPEAVSKRNRFMDIPDDLLQAATLTWENPEYMYYDGKSAMPQRADSEYMPYTTTDSAELKLLTDAMRRDAGAGTLGHVDWNVITGYNRDLTNSATLMLCYNSEVVPAAFGADSLYDGTRDIYGYMLSVTVSNDCENTLNLLRELK